MTTNGRGTYEVTSWDEQPYHEQDWKLTRAHFTNKFSGDIEGEGAADYLMAYPTDQYASFVGLQRVTGSVGGRRGSFVLQASGTFEGGTAKAEWFVVPSSGTGELAGLTGRGGYQSASGTTAELTLDYQLD